MSNFLCHFLIALGLTGCQGLATKTIFTPVLSLRVAEGFQVGKTRQSEIVSRIGKPNRIFEMSETSLGGEGKIWAYLEGGYESTSRISLSFPANSELVNSVTWGVRDGDPEQNLENALSRFKGADFVLTRPKHWENPHSAPDEIFYEDSKTGLTIIYLQTPKRVTAISWALPDRTTTSDVDPILSAPYPYCIVGLCAGQPKK